MPSTQCFYRRFILSIFAIAASTTSTRISLHTQAYVVQPPPISRATGLPNRLYEWRQQQIRYQAAGDPTSPNAVVLVHGLFVNSDHWRHTIHDLADQGYRVYAIDLLGSGYSSKPKPWDEGAGRLLNGENGRFDDDDKKSVLKNVRLGTSKGGTRTADVDLRHPLGSPYNFYTWSEQICDFTREVVLGGGSDGDDDKKVTLVGNSKGTIVSLQAAADCPNLFNGVFLLNPTFREMHSAEMPRWAAPILKSVQTWLRTKGRGLYAKLAKPGTVKKILMEPYAISSAVDDELVDALLSPLLSPEAPDVVFDTLSYSAGPLPEQILRDDGEFPSESVPVWVSYGTADPWTPGARVQRMQDLESVERVIPLRNVGHCPHDEAPEVVNPLLLDFLDRVKEGGQQVATTQGVDDSTGVESVNDRPEEKDAIRTTGRGPFGLKPAYR